MNKNKFDSVEDIVLALTAVTAAVVISGYLKMGFWETFFSGLFAGLVLVFITWIIKNIIKKKLCIIITTKKITAGKFKISILLWNHSWLKEVYNNDYGERGLGLITDYGTTIEKLDKPNGIKFAKNFKFSRIPDTAKNSLNLNMDTLTSNAFVEFDFEIHNLKTTDFNSMIILPSDTVTDKSFGKTPSISLHYDRMNLNIRELKYKKSLQLFHWVCRFSGVLTFIGTIISLILFGYDTVITFAGATLFIIFITSSISMGGFIPTFVIKHMKNKGYITIKSKKII